MPQIFYLSSFLVYIFSMWQIKVASNILSLLLPRLYFLFDGWGLCWSSFFWNALLMFAASCRLIFWILSIFSSLFPSLWKIVLELSRLGHSRVVFIGLIGKMFIIWDENIYLMWWKDQHQSRNVNGKKSIIKQNI